MEVVEKYKEGFKPTNNTFLNEERSKKIILILFALFFVYIIGFFIFAYNLNFKDTSPNEPTDAIIVLTGEQKRITDSIKEFANGNAKKLFISGIYKQSSLEKLIDKTINDLQKGKLLKTSKDNLKSRIFMGRAENTIENGLESANWIKRNNIESIRLMTSYYHMPRSKLIFEKYIPHIRIIEHPITFSEQKPSILSNKQLLKLTFSEYNKYILTYLWNKAGFESTFILKIQENL
ncbi:YdcF family protein [bacterium]|nr:YdcF family protein [bacterium]